MLTECLPGDVTVMFLRSVPFSFETTTMLTEPRSRPDFCCNCCGLTVNMLASTIALRLSSTVEFSPMMIISPLMSPPSRMTVELSPTFSLCMTPLLMMTVEFCCSCSTYASPIMFGENCTHTYLNVYLRETAVLDDTVRRSDVQRAVSKGARKRVGLHEVAMVKASEFLRREQRAHPACSEYNQMLSHIMWQKGCQPIQCVTVSAFLRR